MTQPKFDVFNEEWANKIVGRVSKKGIDAYLGLKITEVKAGRLVCEMPVTAELITGMGNMHGGCLSALCDHVQETVMYPVMPEGYWAATTEFKINLTAPVTGGTCVATAEIVSSSASFRRSWLLCNSNSLRLRSVISVAILQMP